MWRASAKLPSDYEFPVTPSTEFGFRVFICVVLGTGVTYGILIINTFRHYGTQMDEAWKRRVESFIANVAPGPTYPPLPPQYLTSTTPPPPKSDSMKSESNHLPFFAALGSRNLAADHGVNPPKPIIPYQSYSPPRHGAALPWRSFEPDSMLQPQLPRRTSRSRHYSRSRSDSHSRSPSRSYSRSHTHTRILTNRNPDRGWVTTSRSSNESGGPSPHLISSHQQGDLPTSGPIFAKWNLEERRGRSRTRSYRRRSSRSPSLGYVIHGQHSPLRIDGAAVAAGPSHMAENASRALDEHPNGDGTPELEVHL